MKKCLVMLNRSIYVALTCVAMLLCGVTVAFGDLLPNTHFRMFYDFLSTESSNVPGILTGDYTDEFGSSIAHVAAFKGSDPICDVMVASSLVASGGAEIQGSFRIKGDPRGIPVPVIVSLNGDTSLLRGYGHSSASSHASGIDTNGHRFNVGGEACSCSATYESECSEYCPSPSQSDFSITQTLMIQTGFIIDIHITAYVMVTNGEAQALADPMISIDPAFLAEHPGYSIEFSPGLFSSPLYGNFAGAGIWEWVDGSDWTQITPNNPELMIPSGDTLYGSFAGNGIWQWNSGSWIQATPNNPDLMVMVVNNTTLYGSFAGGGIWKWDGYNWTQVTPNNPDLMVANNTTLYGSFAGGGIWQWDGDNWTQVTPNNPDLMVVNNTTLYGSFAGGGIWKWDGSNWTQLTPNNPDLMVANNTTLYGSFAGGGIWQWDGDSWTQATSNNPINMVADSDGKLYGSFAENGIWKWDGSSWTQVTPNNPVSMIGSY